MQNLLNIDGNTVNGSQLLAAATPERSRLATFLASNCFVGFASFVTKNTPKKL